MSDISTTLMLVSRCGRSYRVKDSTLSCTVGAPRRTAIGEANEEESADRTVETSDSGPETGRTY